MTRRDDGVSQFRPAPTFEAFYRKTVDETRRVAGLTCSHGHDPVAHDAVQDAYVVMLERWRQRCLRSLDDNQRYVIRIAVLKVVDWYRGQRRTAELELCPDDGVEERGYLAVLDELTLLAEVRELVNRQPPRRRAAAVLRFFADCTYPEIAETLGVTESTVRTQVQQVVKQLKPLIERINNDTRGGERP